MAVGEFVEIAKESLLRCATTIGAISKPKFYPSGIHGMKVVLMHSTNVSKLLPEWAELGTKSRMKIVFCAAFKKILSQPSCPMKLPVNGRYFYLLHSSEKITA
jgi:hypothetical protein